MANGRRKAANLDMTKGEPARLLVLFAIPMLIGAVFQLMYNMTDTLVVGRFASVDALAAIGATSSTTSLIIMLGQGLTNAVSVVISQAEGAGQQERMKRCVAHALYLVAAGSLILGLASFLGARPFLELLGTPVNIVDDAVAYVQITGGLSVALICYNGVSAVLRAIGDSKTPLYFLILCSLLNVALDLVFVIAFHWDVPGVAIATVDLPGGVRGAVRAVYDPQIPQAPAGRRRLPAGHIPFEGIPVHRPAHVLSKRGAGGGHVRHHRGDQLLRL